MSARIEKGSRVRLKAETAQQWVDKKLQVRAERGVPGIVSSVIGTAIPYPKRSFRITFEKQGRLPAMHAYARSCELDLLP